MIIEINIHQEREWKKIIQKSKDFDSYHTWEYHKLSNDANPVLLVYHENNDFIAIPFLKRTIPNTNYFDLSCVYGFTGPISSKSFFDIPDEMKENFRKALLLFLDTERIVSVFSRLHPFINQMPLMESLEGIHENGNGVLINLKESIDKQRDRYQSGLYKHIVRLKRDGFYIKDSKSPQSIKEFYEIYTENMERVGASSYYMFSEEYFKKLLNSTDYHSKLFLVFMGDIAICGYIILFTKNIIQSHLGATRTDYLKYSPAKFITDEISLLGRQMGMKYFNLGGGLAYKRDSLFAFKSSFSNIYYDYKTWRYISDKEKYEELLAERNLESSTNIDFFPLYRCPNHLLKDLALTPV